jgi:hypothetical protein
VQALAGQGAEVCEHAHDVVLKGTHLCNQPVLC